MKDPTIAEVAKRAGVAKSTVSAVLNDKGVVRASTRQAVLKAIEELNYRPRASARRRFQGAPGRSICFVVKEPANPYYAEALAGIQAVAREKGCLVFVGSSEGEYGIERQIVEQCMAREFDGLVVTPILDDESDLSHIFELKRNNVPFVLLERVRGVQASLVDVDNVQASSEAVRYLLAQGHARIAHFAGPRYSAHSEERLEGVRRAFSESRLGLDPRQIVHAGDAMADGYREGLRCFRDAGAARPTAVTCYNDLVAIGLMKALAELGLRVPDDVSVVGFDDLDMLQYLPVPLTSVHVPKFDMGRTAAEMLLRQIESPAERPVERATLQARLVVRQSTRALGAPAP